MSSVPRWLKALTYGMGVLIIILASILIGELARRAFTAGDTGGTVAPLPPIGLQAGDRISQITGGDDQALILIDRADGTQRVLLLDLASGAIRDWPLAP